MSVDPSLISIEKDDYGDKFPDHVLEVYKCYVETVDKISSRRQAANSFFLTVNTAIVALVGYLQLGGEKPKIAEFYWLIALAGIVLCFSWYRLLLSFKGLNSGKFKVIHQIEKLLPISPYGAEWEAIGKGEDPKLYMPFTKVEIVVPWVFLSLHIVVLLRSIFWNS